MQHEITTPDDLLDETGGLKHKGFSRKPVLTYNPENIRVLPGRALNRLRTKEWDYYGVTAKNHFFSVSVANVGYLGIVFAYLIDFEAKTQAEKTIVTPLGAGCRLPRSSGEGDISFRKGGVSIDFRREPGRRVVSVDWPRFDGGKKLAVYLEIDQPDDMDSIVMATPIGKNHFYYNQKINCMPARGDIRIGHEPFDMRSGEALACLDWGRGAWEYKTFWNWASASGYLDDGRRIGLNLGRGFGDLSRATENCFFLDGRMTKLASVEFKYDPRAFMKPWVFADNEDRMQLTFTPFFERVTRTNLVALKSDVHQMFGRYSGFVTKDDGTRIAIRDLVGWAEEHRARW